MIVVLIGPHAAGKTTLGRLLAARLGVPFEPEIGWELAQDPTWRPEGKDAGAQQLAFDREVFRRELERDLAHADRPLRVVETWHAGNLAYVAHRSPALLDEQLTTLRAHLGGRTVLALPIDASDETLRRRQHEPGAAAFFRAVGRSAPDWARSLGCRVLPTVHTDPLPVIGSFSNANPNLRLEA